MCCAKQDGEMYIHDIIAVEEKPLGIPYYRDDPSSHSYVNLRDEPEKVNVLPELKDSPTLRDFVMALNAPTGPFETFGCEEWSGPWSHEKFPGFDVRHGSYVDFAFVDKARCGTQLVYRDLIDKFRQYAAENRVYDVMQVFFELRPTVSPNASWWTLGVWIYGVGRNNDEAKRWWKEALEYFKACLVIHYS
jgi:hypothetical protein